MSSGVIVLSLSCEDRSESLLPVPTLPGGRKGGRGPRRTTPSEATQHAFGTAVRLGIGSTPSARNLRSRPGTRLPRVASRLARFRLRTACAVGLLSAGGYSCAPVVNPFVLL